MKYLICIYSIFQIIANVTLHFARKYGPKFIPNIEVSLFKKFHSTKRYGCYQYFDMIAFQFSIFNAILFYCCIASSNFIERIFLVYCRSAVTYFCPNFRCFVQMVSTEFNFGIVVFAFGFVLHVS